MYGKERSQFFDVWRPHSGVARGVAMMIHGGFWRARYDLAHASHLCKALADSGLAVANLEYRRVGEPGGGWPGSLQDVVQGAEAVRAHFGAEPVVLGHSAGGHLALRMASEHAALGGVVALAPVADLRLAHELNLSNGAVAEFLSSDPATNPELLRSACPLQQPSSAKTTLIHGTRDEVVPIEISRNFAKAHGNVSLIEIPGADHFDVIDPESSAWPIVRDCVLKLL